MIESFGCFFFVSTELSIRNGSCSSSIKIIFVARRSTMASFSSVDIPNKLNTFRLCLVGKLRELCKHIEAELT